MIVQSVSGCYGQRSVEIGRLKLTNLTKLELISFWLVFKQNEDIMTNAFNYKLETTQLQDSEISIRVVFGQFRTEFG